MTWTQIVIPIAVGALIGYGTNYIAIKMLFRPRRAHYIGKWKLPFTPGVIPKNQARMAEAVGSAIENELFTADDIVNHLNSGDLRQKFCEAVEQALCQSELKLCDIGGAAGQKAGKLEEGLSNYLCDEIIRSVDSADLVPILQTLSQSILANSRRSALTMFLTPNAIENLCNKASEGIKKYINENGKRILQPIILSKSANVTVTPVKDNLANCGISSEDVSEFAGILFDEIALKYSRVFIQELKVKQTVQDKINAMDVKDLERLLMQLMKQELQAVINLGALLGALIGVINIFI